MRKTIFGSRIKSQQIEPLEMEIEKPQQNSLPAPFPMDIEVVQNRIYFYSDINEEKILYLNKSLRELRNKVLHESIVAEGPVMPIYLHINSGGGTIVDAMSTMDDVLKFNQQTPITTIVDGFSASAATFISIVGNRRLIKRNSLMLIHQLSSGFWGTYENFNDNKQNLDLLMTMIKSVYKKYTKLPVKILNEILKRDLYITATDAIKYGLADDYY
jgi:ATP-dependent protease ClpP protease subunit